MKKHLALSLFLMAFSSALTAQSKFSQFSVPSARPVQASNEATPPHALPAVGAAASMPSALAKSRFAHSRPHTSNPPVNPVGFVNATSIPAGGLTEWSAVEADFNGDGKPDIAAPVRLGTTSFAVSVVLNGGNGTFQTPQLTANPNGVDGDQLLVGDFNGDGKQDLIVVHATSPATFEVWLGNGMGGFTVLGSPTTITSNF